MKKTFAEAVAADLGLANIGPLVQAPIALSAAQDEQTIVNVTTGQRVVIEKIELVAAAAGTLAIWSGSVATGTRMTGDMALAANGEYVWQELFTQAAADDVVFSRTTNFAVAGTISYRVVS